MPKSGKITTKNRSARTNITRRKARRVRAAAANTSERITGPAEVARAGLAAASDDARSFTDAVGQSLPFGWR